MTPENIAEAKERLSALVKVCSNKTGQSYKVRSLIYSLWNGKPASLLNLITLDNEIRCNVLVVCAAFGDRKFFYDEIKAAFVERGLFDWFVEEGDVK